MINRDKLSLGVLKMKPLSQKTLVLLGGLLLLFLSYSINIFDLGGRNGGIVNFHKFQKDSEGIVSAGVLFEATDNNAYYGLNRALDQNNRTLQSIDENSLDVARSKDGVEAETIQNYKSSIGLQGHFFRFLYKVLNIRSFSIFRALTAFASALVIMLICYELYKKYGLLFASVFWAVCLLSPWMIVFARNLYWMMFAWFLPLLFTLKYLSAKTKKAFSIYLGLVFVSMLVKVLCSNEYLSSIMIMTTFPIIADFFTAKPKDRKLIIAKFLKISLALIGAVVIGISVLALARGDGNLFTGFKNVYEQDVVRRMEIGNKDFAVAALNESKKVSALSVVRTYMEFKTPLLLGLIRGESFMLLLITSLILCIAGIIRKKPGFKSNLIIWLVLLLTPLSWFVLAKPHSYIHAGINDVLWYFGFVQIVIYVIVRSLLMFATGIKKRRSNHENFSW